MPRRCAILRRRRAISLGLAIHSPVLPFLSRHSCHSIRRPVQCIQPPPYHILYTLHAPYYISHNTHILSLISFSSLYRVRINVRPVANTRRITRLPPSDSHLLTFPPFFHHRQLSSNLKRSSIYATLAHTAPHYASLSPHLHGLFLFVAFGTLFFSPLFFLPWTALVVVRS